MSQRFMTMRGCRRAGGKGRQMAVNEHTGGRSTYWVSGRADDGGDRACLGPASDYRFVLDESTAPVPFRTPPDGDEL